MINDVAALRGFKDATLNSIISTLEIIKQLPDEEKNNGINGLIKSITRERDQFKKPRRVNNKKSQNMPKINKEQLKIISECLRETPDADLLQFQRIIKESRGHDKPYVPYTNKEVMAEIKRRNLNKK